MTLPQQSQNGNKVKLIIDTLVNSCFGKENAKNRKELYRYFKQFYPDLDEKEMRDIYHEHLLIGWCKDGTYVVESIEETKKAIISRRKMRDSHDAYIGKLEDHLQFLLRKKAEEERRKREGQSPQMELF